MASRIAATFDRMRRERRVGLVTFVTAGDPTLERSVEILRTLDESGADVIEVGVPFSDPLADGPVIQAASARALRAGMTLERTLDLVARCRLGLRAPIVVFSYLNPVLRYGAERFADQAAAAGVDGVLFVDLPIEEARPLRDVVLARSLDPIFLVSPTTSDERIRAAAELGEGFLYAIARLGVTGVRAELARETASLLERIRRITAKGVGVGFGVSSRAQVVELGRWADAAVVGSAIVDLVGRHEDDPSLLPHLADFVRSLAGLDRTSHEAASGRHV